MKKFLLWSESVCQSNSEWLVPLPMMKHDKMGSENLKSGHMNNIKSFLSHLNSNPLHIIAFNRIKLIFPTNTQLLTNSRLSFQKPDWWLMEDIFEYVRNCMQLTPSPRCIINQPPLTNYQYCSSERDGYNKYG